MLARTFSNLRIDAAVTVCSSSGWAHGVPVTGRKIVYCYTPARWLYQTDRYLGRPDQTGGAGHAVKRRVLESLRPRLERWDRAAAASADRYLVVSSAVAAAVRDLYGIEPSILPPPPAIDSVGPQQPVAGLEPGFWLCVSRLLPYKNVDAIVEAAPRSGGHEARGGGRRTRALAARGAGRSRRDTPRQGFRRPAPMVLRELPRAHRSVVRGLRADTARGCGFRQAECGAAGRRIPRHDRRGADGCAIRCARQQAPERRDGRA